MRYIWTCFRELAVTRQFAASSNALIPQPISALELVAWQQLAQIRLSRFELACLSDLDRLYIAAFYENQKAARPKGRA